MEKRGNNHITIEKEIITFTWTGIIISLIFAAAAITGLYFLMRHFEVNKVKTTIAILAGVLIYAIILFLVLGKKKETREVKFPVKVIEKPMVKFIEKPVIKVLEKPVTKVVEKPVRKTVYLEKPKKKLSIPKYEYIGSTETKTYHKRNCRFRKLIKRKYQVSNNSEKYFTSRKYKSCNICIKKIKPSESKKLKNKKKKIIKKKSKPVKKQTKPQKGKYTIRKIR